MAISSTATPREHSYRTTINAETYTSTRELMAISAQLGVKGLTAFSEQIASEISSLFAVIQDAVSDVSDYLDMFNHEGSKGMDSLKKIIKSTREARVTAIKTGSLLHFRTDLKDAMKAVHFIIFLFM
jgi:Membrane-associated apoptosis protein